MTMRISSTQLERRFRFDNELQVNSVKVGLNYHFNNVYTPLK